MFNIMDFKFVDFTVMGLDKETSDYLNWALRYRQGLEFHESNIVKLIDAEILGMRNASAVIDANGAGHFQNVKKILNFHYEGNT